MFLMLLTQGVAAEIGTKYDELCLHKTSDVGDITQTDIKLQKALTKWLYKHNIKYIEAFSFNVALGIAKVLAHNYSVDYGMNQFDDAYNAALQGVANAYLSFHPVEEDRYKEFTRVCCRSSIFDELRKIKRWNKEISFTAIESTWNNKQSSSGGGQTGDATEGPLSYTDAVSVDSTGLGIRPLWIEETDDPLKVLLKKEKNELALRKAHQIQSGLNERELYVLWHTIMTDEPETYRAMAEEFKCSKDSIMRDFKRIKTMLREVK